jgi:hypothetical protein
MIVTQNLVFISVVNLKSNPGEIFREESNVPNPLKADCTLTLSDDDMESLVSCCCCHSLCFCCYVTVFVVVVVTASIFVDVDSFYCCCCDTIS